MIEKISEIINEAEGITERVAVVADGQENTNKVISIVDRTTLRVVKTKEIQMFDSKNNFTPLFKNYANKYFGGINGFLKNAMFVNTLEEALFRLKKEKRFIEVEDEA